MHPLGTVEISPEVSALPKADLHLHAEAGPRLHRILAERAGTAPFDWSDWVNDVMTNFASGMVRLKEMSKELVTVEEDAVPRNFLARVTDVLDESARSGAIYVEVRFGRETIMRPDFMTLFRKAENSVAAKYPFFMAEALATLIPQKDLTQTERLVGACVRAAKEGLAGVDIIPEPYVTEADWTETVGWAEPLENAGLALTIHAGEFSTANLAAVLRVPGVRRIGHGIQTIVDSALLDQVAKAGVALECCPTSNVILGAVNSFEDHPLPKLVEAGLPVTINTDNPVHFGTNISQEYERVRQLGLTAEDLAMASRNAIEFAFTSEARRERLRDHLNAVQPV